MNVATKSRSSEVFVSDLLYVRIQRLASRLTLLTTREVLSGTGITVGEWRLICCLTDRGQQNLTAISSYIGIDIGATSRLLKGAEAKGLVTRRQDPSDGRAKLFDLSEKAIEFFDEKWPKAQALIDWHDSLYQDSERQLMGELIKRAMDKSAERLKKEQI